MAGPDPAVAAVRLVVRRELVDLPRNALALAAVSGGADSLALLAALTFEARGAGVRAGCVHVDHGLRAGSAEVAAQVAAVARRLSADPVDVVRVEVDSAGGPEAAARTARYEALDAAAARHDAAVVLLGHTRDDQAESVLLGLARGSGARSLAGMAQRRGVYRRPLLTVSRSTTRAACLAAGLTPWDDPSNEDRSITRNRVRLDALPALDAALGPGVSDALARTADLLRADADLLDAYALQQKTDDVAALAELPTALRTRVLRRVALDAGSPAGALTAAHVQAMDALVTDWHGQRAVSLPGGLAAYRECDRLVVRAAAPGSE